VTVPWLFGRVVVVWRRLRFRRDRLPIVAGRQQPEHRARRTGALLVGVRVHILSLLFPAQAFSRQGGLSAEARSREGGEKKGPSPLRVMALCLSVLLLSGYITR
jgi:hypothetical protein